MAIAVLALLVPAGASAIVPNSFENPASHDTSQQFAPGNVQRQDTPNDPNYDEAEPDTQQPPANRSTNIYDERFDLFGFSSALTPPTTIYNDGPNAGKGKQISGFNAAGAWKLTRGNPAVTIAILDTGIKWDKASLRRRIHLNTGELPWPEDSAGQPHSTYDLNGDGVVNVDDYSADPRVTHTGLITAEDLINTFGHCQITSHLIVGGFPCPAGGKFDNDGNGYANDIAGWDFFDNDNDPLDQSSYFAASNHGSGRASDAAEEGNDGSGSIGVCPHCQLMPLRIWDTFVSDGNTFGQGIIYAADNGAKVIEGANGSLYHSAFAEQASQWAYDRGVVQTFSGDDLNTGNHNYPANYGHAMLIEGTVPDNVGLGQPCPGGTSNPFCAVFPTTGTGTDAPPGTYFRGANTTQFGGKSSISMEGPTGSVNTGKASGAAGLVVSAALDHSPPITLAPDETREILEQTAEDVTPGNTLGSGTPDPAQVGWDSHFGWGRVNLGAAVSVAADPTKIPDIAAIDSPDWYAPLTGKTLDVKGLADAPRDGHAFHYKLEWGPGLSPTDSPTSQWHTIADANATAPVTDLGSIDLDTVRAAVQSFTVPLDPGGPVFSPTSPNPFQQQFTVRLTVTGPGRLQGVDRRVFTAIPPSDGLRPGYPKKLGTGGEAPVRYADLNGDNVQELIVPGEDGTVHAYEPDGSELPGWPVHTQIQNSAQNHLGAPGIASVVSAGAPPREPPRGAAVADIDGDGRPEVIDTAGTHLYVWEADGSVRPGFPVQSDPNNCGPAFEHQPDKHLKCGFLASPTVADLEGSGRRSDIVVPALDGHVYAFKANGDPVPNFPVQLVDPAEVAAHDAVLAESINEVAVGDLNGDHVDDIVAATNETYGATNSGDVSFAGILGGQGQSTRVYAIDGKTGHFLPGWPISISGLIQSTLPLIGPGNDPAILTANGGPEVLASATSGSLATYKPDGTTDQTMRQEDSVSGNPADKTPALNLFESAAVGKLAPGATPSVVKYEISLSAAANLLLVGQNLPYHHLIGAWDSTNGQAQPGFPTITDDFQFLSSSTVAKIDPASSANQIVAGTGLGLLHAYDGQTALDAPGFPKTTGGWLFSPAAISTDGRMADITREGYLFEWQTSAAQCQSEWPTFRHDPQNSGNYDRDGTPPAAPGDVSLTSLGGQTYQLTFKTPGSDGFCGNANHYVASVDGQTVNLGAPGAGGSPVSKPVILPAGAALTFQAVDGAGNVGAPAVVAIPPAAPGSTNPGGGEPDHGGGTPGEPGGNAGGGGKPGGESVCSAGTKVPRSSISHRHLHASKHRIRFAGRSIEVDCLTGKLATGRVKRVLVTIARVEAGGCRFLRRSGRLGRTRACAKPQSLAARIRAIRGHRNKTLWALDLPVRLPRGGYVVSVRGIDATGRHETISRPTNTATFLLR